MKRNLLIALTFMATASFAAAQAYAPATDVLGAHLNYGRGCPACHAPHSGAFGNGMAPGSNTVSTGANASKTFSDQTTTGVTALWGQDVTNLLGQTIVTGGGDYTEVLPTSMAATTPDVGGLLTCLSCHDGNYATGAMMQNKVYETLPGTYASQNVPTLLGNDGSIKGNYLNDHPVGLNATWACGGGNWNCVMGFANNQYGEPGVQVNMTGDATANKFWTNYGFFVSFGNFGGNTAVVLCTTCHNQHVMNVVKVSASNSGGSGTGGMAPGTYQTMFFLRGPYNPNSPTSNEAAQFCRQCHAGESNEKNGGTAGTTL